LENLNGRDQLQGLNIDKRYEDNIKMNIKETQCKLDYGDSEYHQKTVISAGYFLLQKRGIGSGLRSNTHLEREDLANRDLNITGVLQ
jgi:hypothetical protein